MRNLPTLGNVPLGLTKFTYGSLHLCWSSTEHKLHHIIAQEERLINMTSTWKPKTSRRWWEMRGSVHALCCLRIIGLSSLKLRGLIYTRKLGKKFKPYSRGKNTCEVRSRNRTTGTAMTSARIRRKISQSSFSYNMFSGKPEFALISNLLLKLPSYQL